MAGERILVVDDRRENVEFVVEYVLKPNGYVPLVAYDGAEGFQKALTEKPDLILLDMQMPKMTGVEVLEALNERQVQIPVILMTFHGSEELAVRVFRLGVKDYVIKPFEVEEMLSAIERALTEVRLRRERDELTRRILVINRQLEQRVKELNTLYSIGKSVTSLLDLDKLLSRLVEAAVYISGAEEGWLMLVDEETNELYVRAAQGLEERYARSMRLKVKDSLAGKVVRTGEPIVIGGGEHKIKTAYLVKSLMAVPLRLGQRVIGVLSVDNRVKEKHFSKGELYLLSALADYAAIAIENARLFHEVESGHQKLQAILSGVSDAILVADESNRLLLLNNAAIDALGLGAETTVGLPVDQAIPNEVIRDLFARAAAGEKHLRAEVPLDDGRTFNANLTEIPGVGRVVVMQDITYLKELDRMKSEFVATVSHDLRSPLTSIKGFVELLPVVGPVNEKQQEFIDRVRRGVEDVTELVNDLLDLGRIETGVDLEMDVVDLREVILDSVEVLRGHAETKSQELRTEVPEDLPPVWGNRLRLSQVVNNLVGNAIKYTPEGGHILVRAEVESDHLLVHVLDDGIGIPPADQPHIFDKFYRVKSKETDGIHGTGLGLAIVKSVIEKHGGRVWVESEVGKGSTFTFLLPLYRGKEEQKAGVSATQKA